MLLAAKLRALSAVDAGLIGFQPCIAHETRNRILLDPESGHRPGVDHVVGGDQHPDLLADRHDHRVVDLEQVMLALRFLAMDLHVRCGEIAVEAEAVVEIVVAPLPLVAGHLDGHVRRAGILHRQDRLGRREGHEQQDEEGDHRPDHFDDGVFVKLRSLVSLGLAVREDRIEHHREHADEDHDADPHDVRVKVEDLRSDRRDGRLQVVLPDRLRGDRRKRQKRCRGCQYPLARPRRPGHRFPCDCSVALHAFLEHVDDPPLPG